MEMHCAFCAFLCVFVLFLCLFCVCVAVTLDKCFVVVAVPFFFCMCVYFLRLPVHDASTHRKVDDLFNISKELVVVSVLLVILAGTISSSRKI